ncbi:MAG: (2Fe-2S) ferredoxin domain-containing protein, partial [Lentisphaerae bacterium]|nr:(2Fe-2S) ferredoxin domain-containing protein [Lentisphaerota bacterium]
MDKPHIVICIGSSCFARGNERNVAIAEEYL